MRQYRYFSHYTFSGSVRRFRDALRTKHSTFRSAITVSHYCCFWTACCQGIKDSHIFSTFVNAVLVDLYSFLHVYRYSRRYSLRTKHTTFLSTTASFVHRGFSFSHHLTLPKVVSTFQMTSRHDLIGSSRSVEIFEAAWGSSTSGSKSYFLFKLHDPTSGESGRQQQLTTRLSSCILDMCDVFGDITQFFFWLLSLKIHQTRAHHMLFGKPFPSKTDQLGINWKTQHSTFDFPVFDNRAI